MLAAFVYVIESPADGDLLDGRTEGRALCEALRLAEVPLWYSLVTTKRAFNESLTTRLSAAYEHYGRKLFPILHFSMHGNKGGVALTDTSFLRWDDLKLALQPLNNALNGGLLIGMSACFSASGCRMAMFEGADQPFWALVGHAESASWADAAIAYTTFYHRLFKDNASLEDCVAAMKAASGDNRFMAFRGHELKADWALEMTRERQRALSDALATYGDTKPSETGAQH